MLRRLATNKKLLVLVPVVLALVFAGLFLPVRKVSIEPHGRLYLESTITISIGQGVVYASPDTEVRQPDGDVSAGTWTTEPLWSKINEGSGSPNEIYIVSPDNQNTTGECSVQDPANAGTYTAVQIKVLARKSAAAGNQRGLNADIRIGGNLQGVQTLQADLTATFTEYTCTWSGLNFSQTDMNSLQVLFISTGTTSPPPAGRREVHIDYYETVLTYTSPNISNSPSSKDFGVVANGSSNWSNESAPTFPLDDSECYFTVTNNSSGPVDITIKATNFTGGVGWTLAGTVGANIVVMKAGKSGDSLEEDMVTIAVADTPYTFITNLASIATKKWEIKLEAPTSVTDGAQKSSTVTLTATLL